MYVNDYEADNLAAIATEGRMLVIPVKVLPALPRGKGNKNIQIPLARFKKSEEYVRLLEIIPEGATVKIHAGKQSVRFTSGNISNFWASVDAVVKSFQEAFERQIGLKSFIWKTTTARELKPYLLF